MFDILEIIKLIKNKTVEFNLMDVAEKQLLNTMESNPNIAILYKIYGDLLVKQGKERVEEI